MAKQTGTAPGWRRLPGSARQYQNIKSGEIISRREYSKRTSANIKLHGSFEKLAAFNAKTNRAAQLLKPAKGRSSAVKLAPELKRAEIQKREAEITEHRAHKKIQRALQRHPRTPKRVTVSSFKRHHISRGYDLPISYSAIEEAREVAARSGIVFAYYVGGTIIDNRSGEVMTPTYIASRYIKSKFKADEYHDMIEWLMSKSYATLVGLWIRFRMDTTIAQKKNGWRGHV